ncbi:MAG TPA: alpha/beta hydrolase fold domain-containing protein [Pseudonocardiaceae bacterium]|nr:alpha/beta hydrolase fold domain-containing protein [Pseudonocardiaceae bacterium]
MPRPVRRLLAGPPVVRDGQQLDPDLQLLLRVYALEKRSMRANTATAARAAMSGGVPLVSGPPAGPVHTREVLIDAEDGELAGRLYQPAGLAPGSPLVVFYHGGGWVTGDLDTHDGTCRLLALRAATRVLSVDYRRAPEYKFPTAPLDAVGAFRYAVRHAGELGADPRAIAVAGDSAGGNLAAVVCHQTAGEPERPVFALLFYPVTDGTTRHPSRDLFGDGFMLTDADIEWFLGNYEPDVTQRADPRLSVLLAPDLSGFPPTYLATAGFDPLRDEGEALAGRLAEAGVPVVCRRHSDLIHGFATLLGIGAKGREAVIEAAGALRAGFAVATARVRDES